ncbi:MAG TPA: nucleotide exchange factor GrpE [Streptosporangiaceae bacterium]|nr:nucleotide exchange factor GrpE [Streptosporangiaceae bacterium]
MSASEQESQGPVIRDRRRIDPVTGQPRQPATEPGQAGQDQAGTDRAGTGDQAGTDQAGTDQAGTDQASSAAAGQAPRGPGQPRPGKHSESKPGSRRQESADPDQAAAADADQAGTGDQAGTAQEVPEQAAADGAPPADTTNNQTKGADVAAMLAERTADLQRVQAEYANYRKRVERDRVAVREQALASVLSELLPILDDIGRARSHEELTGGFKAVAEALEAAATKLGLTPFGEPGEPFDPNVHEALMHSYSPDVTEPTCVQILQPGYKVGERILRPARVAVAEPTDPAGARTAGEADADGQQENGAPDTGQTG